MNRYCVKHFNGAELGSSDCAVCALAARLAEMTVARDCAVSREAYTQARLAEAERKLADVRAACDHTQTG